MITRKLNTDEFIKRSNIIHNNEYDYSLVKYKNNKTKVKIICKEHGIFEQIPMSHLSGAKCLKCFNKSNTKTTEQFILDAKKIHNNIYNYSLVEYKNAYTKVKIICKEHGIFKQQPNNHLNGQGCPKCISKINTTDEFIKKSVMIHNNKYDYSLTEYINCQIKVKIICSDHGIFEQLSTSHLNGNGCPKCFGKFKTTKEFIQESNIKHNNKYDYSLVEYISSNTKIDIICPTHGKFEQTPSNHLNGCGCVKCANDKIRLTKNVFIDRSNIIHRNKYDYLLVNYINNRIKVRIICPIHGEFEQKPLHHIKGIGCPECKSSKGEIKIKIYLDHINIKYDYQKRFKDCKNIKPLPFDFYLPNKNICIEFDGKQHFEPNDFFGGQKTLNELQIKDKIKTQFCLDNNIKLIRIRFDENVKEKLNEYLIQLNS